MQDRLLGRTALVAGGTGSVGRVLVRALLDAGATVVVPSRSSEKLRGLQAGLGAARGSRLIGLEGDLSSERDAPRLLDEIVSRAGPLDAAIASLGRFVAAPSVLEAPLADLQRVIDSYLVAHFSVARAVLPILRQTAGSYTFVNGPLAFEPLYPGTGLVSTVTAAQAMLARIAMAEMKDSPVRVNEVILYTRFGPTDEEGGEEPVRKADVGQYFTLLLSPSAAGVRGRTLHLDSPRALQELAEASGSQPVPVTRPGGGDGA